ncbi:MAG TPA: hypothetical protein VLT33_15840, partial [Labilithrix sp.]|nr:hypothetical protein [Labilithrix sp.]
MPLHVFEGACIAVVALTLWTMGRARSASHLLRDYALLACAAWLGEDTCIALYRFYAYAPGWHLRLHHVPLLVPLIWPLVILSARDVVSATWPALRGGRPFAVAALVAFDASLVEVVAVRAGLWSWAEAGHLGVPVIGVLGWGFFALGADLALSRARPLLAIALGPLTAHALIVVSWWGLFRWTMRGALGTPSIVGVAVLGLLAVAVAVGTRRRGGAIPLAVAAPRMIAAALFLALLIATAPADVPLWIHAAAVALPYLAATAWPFRGTR